MRWYIKIQVTYGWVCILPLCLCLLFGDFAASLSKCSPCFSCHCILICFHEIYCDFFNARHFRFGPSTITSYRLEVEVISNYCPPCMSLHCRKKLADLMLVNLSGILCLDYIRSCTILIPAIKYPFFFCSKWKFSGCKR